MQGGSCCVGGVSPRHKDPHTLARRISAGEAEMRRAVNMAGRWKSGKRKKKKKFRDTPAARHSCRETSRDTPAARRMNSDRHEFAACTVFVSTHTSSIEMRGPRPRLLLCTLVASMSVCMCVCVCVCVCVCRTPAKANGTAHGCVWSLQTHSHTLDSDVSCGAATDGHPCSEEQYSGRTPTPTY